MRARGAIAIAAIGGLLLAWSVGRAEPARLQNGGIVEGSSDLVILEPETWLGQPLPLMAYLDGNERLARGQWRVVLHRHDCPACHAVIERIKRKQQAGDPPLALAEVPPFGPVAKDLDSQSPNTIWHTRLSDRRQWIVPTPTVLWLTDGVVRNVQVQDRAPVQTEARPAVVQAGLIANEPKVVEHDFGYVEPGRQYEATIELNNPLGQTLNIRKIDIECACTTLHPTPQTLPADGATLTVRFVPPKVDGPYRKHIVLHTNHSALPSINVRIAARINQPLLLSPSSIELAPPKPGERVTANLTVTNHGREPIRLLYSTANRSGCFARLPREPLAAGASALVPIEVVGPGQDRVILKIHTTHPMQTVLTVTLTCRASH